MRGRTFVATATVLQSALDVLLAVLVVLVLVSAIRSEGVTAWWGIGTITLFALVCARGRLARIGRVEDVDAVRGRWWPEGVWVAALVVLWALALLLLPSALWIAFPLFFLQMRALGPRRGTVAVVLTTVIAVVGAVGHGLALVGSVIGPVLGAVVVVGVVLGLEAVVRESQERQLVIDALRRTRADLAAAEADQARALERERLAREIHDTLAQGFSSIGLLLRAVERAHGNGGEDGAVEHHLQAAQQAVADNLLEARRVVRALAPPALDGAGLVEALRRLAAQTRAQSGLAVEVDVSGDPCEIPVSIEAALLRVAQSAVANVVQHANASRARVTVTFHDDELGLDVVDDGTGFDPEALPGSHSSGGFGLRAMHSRIDELGGRLVVEPGSAQRGRRQGVALAAIVPLSRAGTDLAQNEEEMQ